ncbi:MAG: alcohol dehydrogenase catalytic domain-containing protein [Rhodanobacter sp.]
MALLPIIRGHEVTGAVDKLGANVVEVAVGDRVALHYLVTCDPCDDCVRGLEPFCRHGRMLGKDVDGGYAEYIVLPARNAIPVAESVDIAAAAIIRNSPGAACSTGQRDRRAHAAGCSADQRLP